MSKQTHKIGSDVIYCGPYSSGRVVSATVEGFVPGFRGIKGLYILRMERGGVARAVEGEVFDGVIVFSNHEPAGSEVCR